MNRYASVAVIMPTYNSGRFIGEALESILRQTCMPEQIIVVDDGSKDDTEEVVRNYIRIEPRIEYTYQTNAGVAAARNTGLNMVRRSDFITFLDADDRWRPKFINNMGELLLGNPQAVCAFANFVRFDHTTGQTIGRDQFSYYPELRAPDIEDELPSAGIRILRRPWAFPALVKMGEIPAFPVVMMYRRRLISGLRFDPKLKICEDTHFALQAFMRGDVSFVSEVLCEVRRHNSNATLDHHKIAIHKLKALKALRPYVHGKDNIVAYYDRLVKAHMDAAIHQTRNGHVLNGIRDYYDSFNVPGSLRRKVNGSVRVAMAIPKGLIK